MEQETKCPTLLQSFKQFYSPIQDLKFQYYLHWYSNPFNNNTEQAQEDNTTKCSNEIINQFPLLQNIIKNCLMRNLYLIRLYSKERKKRSKVSVLQTQTFSIKSVEQPLSNYFCNTLQQIMNRKLPAPIKKKKSSVQSLKKIKLKTFPQRSNLKSTDNHFLIIQKKDEYIKINKQNSNFLGNKISIRQRDSLKQLEKQQNVFEKIRQASNKNISQQSLSDERNMCSQDKRQMRIQNRCSVPLGSDLYNAQKSSYNFMPQRSIKMSLKSKLELNRQKDKQLKKSKQNEIRSPLELLGVEGTNTLKNLKKDAKKHSFSLLQTNFQDNTHYLKTIKQKKNHIAKLLFERDQVTMKIKNSCERAQDQKTFESNTQNMIVIKSFKSKDQQQLLKAKDNLKKHIGKVNPIKNSFAIRMKTSQQNKALEKQKEYTNGFQVFFQEKKIDRNPTAEKHLIFYNFF